MYSTVVLAESVAVSFSLRSDRKYPVTEITPTYLITQNIKRKRARFQEKYSKGGITRAAVNELCM